MRHALTVLALLIGIAAVVYLLAPGARPTPEPAPSTGASAAEAGEPRPKRPTLAPPLQPAATATLSGLVIRDRTPAPGAQVDLRLDGEHRTVTTDPEGRFQFSAVPGGHFSLTASKGSEASEVFGPFLLQPGQDLRDVELVLHAAARLTGTVRDALTGQTVAGAQVRCGSGTARTDHAGRFELGPLPATGAFLEASAEGYEPRVQWLALDGARDHGGLEVFLLPSTRLSGEVTRLGTPVEGAAVWAERGDISSRFERQGPVQTGPDGAFELPVSAGEWILAAAAPGGARVEGPRLTVAEGSHHEGLKLELGEALSAEGTVTRAGLPLERASLLLIEARSQQPAGSGATGPGGAFRIDGLAVGSYLVQIQHGAFTAQAGPYEVTGGQGPWQIDLPDGQALTGHVEPPAAGVVVRLRTSDWAGPYSAETLTDAEGAFRFQGLPVRQVTVEAEADQGYAAVTTLPRDGVVLKLRQSGVEGVVVDERGRSVSDFVLEAEPLGGGLPVVRPVLHPDGEFSLPLAPGRWSLNAKSRGYGAAAPVTVEIGSGEIRSNLRLALEAAQAVTGQVVDSESGAPLSGVEVEVLRSRERQNPQAERWALLRTDASGRFHLAALPKGAWLRLRKESYQQAWLRADRIPDDGRIPMLAGRSGRGEQVEPYEGVGMALNADQPRQIFIGAVFDGSPAQAAGVVQGDELLSVDGVSVAQLGVRGAIQRIMGPAGTTVRLRLRRGDRIFELVVRRRSIRL